MMATLITELVALGALPLVLALVVYFTACELLLWPPLEAKLWGGAVAVVFLVMSSVLCTRFLAVADGKREPREVGRFSCKAYFAPWALGPGRSGGLSSCRPGRTLSPPVVLPRGRSTWRRVWLLRLLVGLFRWDRPAPRRSTCAPKGRACPRRTQAGSPG